jgi:hypothetical protein
MGIININNVQAATFDPTQDTAAVSQCVHHHAQQPTLEVVFVGESHDFVVDKTRRNDIVEQFRADQRIILVTERAMKFHSGRELADSLTGPNHIVEPISGARSADESRNIDIVQRIVAESSKDNLNRRLVLIMFGAVHEIPIRNEFAKQTPATETFGWWYFPPISEQAYALPGVAFNPQGYDFVGFTARPDPERVEAVQKVLLTKGRWVSAFSIDVMAAYRAPDTLGRRELYAVYGLTANPVTQQTIANLDVPRFGGTVSMPVNAANAVGLVLMQNDGQYQALK